MTESALFTGPDDEVGSAGFGRRKTLLAVAGGAVLIGGAAFLLLGGGGSDSTSVASAIPVHRVKAAPTVSPSPSAAPEAQLQVFQGSIGRDPFEAPQRVQLAMAPKAAAPVAPAAGQPAPAAPAAGALPAAVPGALPVLPVTGAGPGGTVVTVVPPGGAPAPAPVVTQPLEYVQLLAAHRSGAGWVVDIRTAKGVTKGIKEGTKDVGGSLFFFVGEDEQAGKPTFVFTVGESAGGNLVANPKAGAPRPGTAPKPDDSTLVLRHGQVDGGISPS